MKTEIPVPETIRPQIVTVTAVALPKVALRMFNDGQQAMAYADAWNENVFYVETNHTYYVISHGKVEHDG